MVAKALGQNPAALVAGRIAGLGTLSCYAGKPNHYVVGSDGSVYKCTVALDLPENHIGRISESGDLLHSGDREDLWTSANSLTDVVCGKCAFHSSCMGIHCPLERIQTQSQPCPTHKVYIDSLLDIRSDG